MNKKKAIYKYKIIDLEFKIQVIFNKLNIKQCNRNLVYFFNKNQTKQC